jgi:hypothetical protein
LPQRSWITSLIRDTEGDLAVGDSDGQPEQEVLAVAVASIRAESLPLYTGGGFRGTVEVAETLIAGR